MNRSSIDRAAVSRKCCADRGSERARTTALRGADRVAGAPQ
jgi:hypothetical protein